MANPIMKMEENRMNQEVVINADDVMTVNGALQVTGFMGLILVIAAAYVWSRYSLGYVDQVTMLMGAGLIVGLISGLLVAFLRLHVLVPVYAAAEGLLLGGISAVMESSYPGIVSQAVAGTFATLFTMLILYRAGIVKCTEKFRSVVFTATLSVLVIYLVNIIGHFFGYAVPMINSSSNWGILFSIVVIFIAASNLIVDFDSIELGAQRMAPKKYEWFCAFGLIATLVWLYLEILKLLAKLNNRD